MRQRDPAASATAGLTTEKKHGCDIAPPFAGVSSAAARSLRARRQPRPTVQVFPRGWSCARPDWGRRRGSRHGAPAGRLCYGRHRDHKAPGCVARRRYERIPRPRCSADCRAMGQLTSHAPSDTFTVRLQTGTRLGAAPKHPSSTLPPPSLLPRTHLKQRSQPPCTRSCSSRDRSRSARKY